MILTQKSISDSKFKFFFQGKLEGGKDTCQGDSGGGLYVFDSNINKYVIVGITSYGDGCGQTGKPG